MELELPTAAAVFDVGILEQSPRENTFLYLTCCKVWAFTSTNPEASVNPGAFRRKHSGVLIGGETCNISYGIVVWRQEGYINGNYI